MSKTFALVGGRPFILGGSPYVLERNVVNFLAPTGPTVSFEGVSFPVTIELAAPAPADIDIDYTTSNGTAIAGTDYTTTAGTATILEGQSSVIVNVPTTLRSGFQGNRAFTFTISNPASEADLTFELPVPAASMTITETEEEEGGPVEPTLSIAPATATEGNNMVFTVTISPPINETVSFSYATGDATAEDGVDYTGDSDSATITANQPSTTISIPTALRAGYQGSRYFTLTISAASSTSFPSIDITQAVANGIIGDTEAPTGNHAYFESLIVRPDFLKGISYRPQVGQSISSVHYEHQLKRPNEGGYAQSNSTPAVVLYDPVNDLDPHAQDAAKIVVPAFNINANALLAGDIDASQLQIPCSDLNGDVTKVSTALQGKGVQIRIGDEVVETPTSGTILDRTTGILTLAARGTHGTTATSHASGTALHKCTNNLTNQVKFPINTSDGNTYFITWDCYFTDSWLNNGIGNYKAFQLDSDASIWLEPQTHFDGDGAAGFDPNLHVALARYRSYNNIGGDADYSVTSDSKARRLGPGVTDNNRIEPMLNEFIIHPNRWTRWFIKIEQRADDYDLFSAWMADEVQNPVQLYSNIPVSVRASWGGNSVGWTGPDTIGKHWVEFNTSTTFLPEGRMTDFRDLVAYIRNLAVLLNPPSDVSSLLVKPEAS